MRNIAAAAILALLVAGCTALDSTARGTAAPNTAACDGASSGGLVPQFCVNLPARAASFASMVSPSDVTCGTGFVPAAAACEDINVPVLRGSTGSSGVENGDLVCGEGGIHSVRPRFCIDLPTQPNAAGANVRPGTAELERFTGVSFAAAGNPRAFLFLDEKLSSTARTQLTRTFATDVANVEQQFAHTFVRAPAVYVFATGQTFGRALTGVFGYSQSLAETLSREHGGVLLPGADAALVNWESARGNLGLVRHELTHAAIREIAGSESVPAWTDEGLATLAEDPTGNGGDIGDRYATRSLIDNGRLRLATLRFSGPLAHYEYVASREAATMLLTDLGQPGLNRILVATGAGTPFADAFQNVAGRSLASFVGEFVNRLHERLPSPRIVTQAAAANGDVSWYAFGFVPGGQATVSVTSADYGLGYTAAVDIFGAVSGTFGSTAPEGAYTITVSDPQARASIELRTSR